MNKLFSRISKFSEALAGEWNNNGTPDAKYMQGAYLYSNAYRAAKTASSLWCLHDRKDFHECHILARVLLERIIYARIARQSPQRAASLLASLVEKETAEIEKWGKLEGLDFKTVLESKREEKKRFLEMAELEKVERSNICELAKEAGLEAPYRSMFRDMSQYVHASFGVSRPKKGDDDCIGVRYMGYVAPMETALWCFVVSRNLKVVPADIFDQYASLHREIQKETTVMAYDYVTQNRGNIGFPDSP